MTHFDNPILDRLRGLDGRLDGLIAGLRDIRDRVVHIERRRVALDAMYLSLTEALGSGEWPAEDGLELQTA